MSSIRNRDKLCRSLDSPYRSASGNMTYFNRWSEVVPSKTALTFAALWDPEEGMVTFSGASLLEPESPSGAPSHPDVFEDDDQSQRVSIDRENSATLVAFQDAFKAFLHRTPRPSEENLKAGQGSRYLHSRASSTFDGLDIYSHDVQVKPKRSLQLSLMDLLDVDSLRPPLAFGGLRLGSDSMLDAYRSGSESDSSSGSRPAHLHSRFSTTTTSTSNYIDVTTSALQSLRASQTSPTLGGARPDACISPSDSWPYLPRRRRLLRKPRPLNAVNGDATPTRAGSVPSTPRKATPKPWMSTPPSPSSFATASSSSRAGSMSGEERRGRFLRPIAGTILRASTRASTPAPTPPNTPKSPRLRLPFAFRLRRKSLDRTCPDESDGWVCVDVAPEITQYYMADVDDD